MDEKDDSKIAFEPSILSFEDEDKIFSSGSLPLMPKIEENNEPKDKNQEKTKNKRTININTQKLTYNSKIRLLISVILVCLILVFIPFHSVANSYLITIENDKLFNSMENFVSLKTLNSSGLKNLYTFFSLFLNKDFMAGYLCVLYTLFQPFIAMKVIYGAINIYYCLILNFHLYHKA